MFKPIASALRPPTPLAIALAMTVLAVGCGGGSDEGPASREGSTAREGSGPEGGSGGSGSAADTSVTTSSLTKVRFVNRVNAFCTREREELLERMGVYFQKHQSRGGVPAEVLPEANRAVYVPIIEAEIAKIQALGAPAGDEAEIEAFLGAQRKGVEELAAQKEVKSRFQIERIFKEAGDLARVYGLKACASG